MESQRYKTAPLLVLWDVDHTLIQTGGVGREVFKDAFEQATGLTMERMADVSGKTEPDIFDETARMHGISVTTDLFEVFATRQSQGYETRADEMRSRGRALPGALDALNALASVPEIVQSVLTGNTRPVARTKLRVFGLTQHLDLEVGAYGSDDPVRSRLVKIAQERAASKYGAVFRASSTVLIGDTPNDVATGRDGGARVIAVASGKSTADELRAAGAEHVLLDLSELPQRMQALYGC